MKWNRRSLLGTLAGVASAAVSASAQAQGPRAPVVTLGATALPFKLKDGVKEFHLTAEEIEHEFAPGTKIKAWGYNGRTPGPTIEATEGDKVRILLTNRLKEHTSIHWHGVLLPNGMDGVGGLTQPHIAPGENFAYEFTLRQHGTQMYHPHADELVQMAMGMMGLFIIHPRDGARAVDRDFAMILHNWAVHPGTYRPDPAVMTDFDLWTINSKVFPAVPPMVVRTGQKVRIRVANLSMHEHPMHIHGFRMKVTGTDGGPVPESAQFSEVTTLIPVGAIRDVEFVADEPGDWPFHCHKTHHTMNAMGHDVPNPIGVKQSDLMPKMAGLLPGYMPMGEAGMAEHQMHAGHMAGPENTMPMMTGTGPFGPLEMGGMLTLIKVRDGINAYDDPGPYNHPAGTRAYRVAGNTPKIDHNH